MLGLIHLIGFHETCHKKDGRYLLLEIARISFKLVSLESADIVGSNRNLIVMSVVRVFFFFVH